MKPMRLAALALLILPIAAESVAEDAAHPREVQAVLDDARRECLARGGTKFEFEPAAVKKIDLTGDGRDDYIIDFFHVTCVDRGALFGGSGGSNLVILVAKRNGGLVRVFDGPVKEHTIVPGTGTRTIRFHLHGAFCGDFGPAPCFKTRRITARPFRFSVR